jgi:hypothetical protein
MRFLLCLMILVTTTVAIAIPAPADMMEERCDGADCPSCGGVSYSPPLLQSFFTSQLCKIEWS